MPDPLLLTVDDGHVRVADRSAPLLRADDLGVLRGDGIFETMHVVDGVVFGIAAHLDRMARSATLMELTPPARDMLERLVAAAAEASHQAWPAGCEGALRISVTRGVEPGGPLTVFATVDPIGAKSLRLRREGVRVLTATTGFATDTKAGAPWLLGGVKSLSYAVNMASLRWAEANDADDVLWTSSDGYALEGSADLVAGVAGRRHTFQHSQRNWDSRWHLRRAVAGSRRRLRIPGQESADHAERTAGHRGRLVVFERTRCRGYSDPGRKRAALRPGTHRTARHRARICAPRMSGKKTPLPAGPRRRSVCRTRRKEVVGTCISIGLVRWLSASRRPKQDRMTDR
ncbi:aminotransferase class IV [Fodinicola feengrottensis]|nr:aminotransferase class IV [Fodinicola feengrottensis]